MDFGGGDEIRFEQHGRAGVVTLTRPNALNAVTHRMVRALSSALDVWETDSRVDVIIIKAEGRAFSAGGDILHIYEAGRAGRPPVDFFADEYRLNARIHGYRKPYVAIVDGIVMGGGVGISFHGSHRVLTENAQFAMPEVGIGFFPDVGASHLLPALAGCFGMYLALTGNRIRYGDALWSGLATHTVKAADLAGLIERLALTGDPRSVLDDFIVHAAPKPTVQPEVPSPRIFQSRRWIWSWIVSSALPIPSAFAAKDAGDDQDAFADQPARRLAPDRRRPDAVDGRMHEDGIPHPQPNAGRA
jgi:enoyl-CoA hydratase